MRYRIYEIVLTFFIVILFTHLQAQAQNIKLTAKEIIEKMIETYKNSISYQDTGIVIETTFSEKLGKIVNKKPFKTYFVRPNLFRFEWKESFYPGKRMYRCVVWCNGKDTYTYWQTGKLERMRNLKDGILANAGVSSGSSYTVPSMLIFSEESFILKNLVIEKITNEEEINRTLCYVIQAKHKTRKKKYFIWIGKKDFLLRKLKRDIITPNLKGFSEEIHQNIRINHEIPLHIFNLKPFEKKSNLLSPNF